MLPNPKPLPPMPDPGLALQLAKSVIHNAQIRAGIRPGRPVKPRPPTPPPGVDTLTR